MSFQENQKLPYRWIFILSAIVVAIVFSPLLPNFKTFGKTTITLLSLFFILFFLSLFFLTLVIKINALSFNYSFSIFFFKIYEKNILWSNIESISIQKVTPLREFGGWGIRYSLSQKIWGIIFQGKNVVAIKEKSNSKIKISIVDDNSIRKVINNYYVLI